VLGLDLAPGAAGGVRSVDPGAVEPVALDPAVARVAVLERPRSKAEILGQLAAELAFPAWFGRTWDALEELLRAPDPDDDRAIVVVWHDPARLADAERSTALAVFAAVAAWREGAGRRPLVVLLDRDADDEGGTMATGAARLPERIRALGKVHHVALIVRSIEDSLGLWRDVLGLELETVMDVPHDRVRIAFLGVGESKVELVEPTDDTTGVARFLAGKGEGFHHVCFEVANLAETLLRLELDGLELIDSAPRRGAEGPVAFIHPRSGHGVLVELIEAPGGPAWASLGFAV
jgi:methylmalonyl-CoA/ethylmalonyl-CoA epimerase